MIKILLVEDEKQLVECLVSSLTRRGYDVYSASNGKEALEIEKNNNPDLVFLDLGLPDMDGREVLKGIRLSNPTRKIVVLSGYSDPSTQKELKELGADYFVNKPIFPAVLYKFIEDTLAAVSYPEG